MPESSGNIEALWELRNEPEMANALAVSLMGERMTNVERVEMHHMLGKLYAVWANEDTHATAFARSATRHGHLGAVLFLESVATELGARGVKDRIAQRNGVSRLSLLLLDVSAVPGGASAVAVIRELLEERDVEFRA